MERAFLAGLVLIGCEATASPPTNEGTGPGIIVANDSGIRIPNFACDSSGIADSLSEASAAPADAGGCTVMNPNVRFRSDVLPVFGGCSGEICHAPWSYETTVGAMSTECCDKRKLVDPGRPATSYLLQKIEGIDLCGNSSKMGDVTPDISRNIQDWICLGAPND